MSILKTPAPALNLFLRVLRHARGEHINVISIPNLKAAQENSWLCQHPRPIRRQKEASPTVVEIHLVRLLLKMRNLKSYNNLMMPNTMKRR